MDETSQALTAEEDATDVAEPAPEPPPADPQFAPGTVRRLDPAFVAFQRVVGWIVTAVMSVGLLVVAAIVWLSGRPALVGEPVAPAGLAGRVGRHRLAVLCLASGPLPAHLLRARRRRHRDPVRRVVASGHQRARARGCSTSTCRRARWSARIGLGRLVVFTAGTDHSRVELPGLSHTVALALRNHLLPRGSDDAV